MSTSELDPEDDMLNEEEEEERDRSFLTPIFAFSAAMITIRGQGLYSIHTEGFFGQRHIDKLNERFKIRVIENAGPGLHIELLRLSRKR